MNTTERTTIASSFALPSFQGDLTSANALVPVKADAKLPATLQSTIADARTIEVAALTAYDKGENGVGAYVTSAMKLVGLFCTAGAGILGVASGIDALAMAGTGIIAPLHAAIVGPLLMGASVAINTVRRTVPFDRLQRTHAQTAKAIADAAANADGLTRAWIATRCAAALEVNARPDRDVVLELFGENVRPLAIKNRSVFKQLERAAALLDTVSDEDRYNAFRMEAVTALVFIGANGLKSQYESNLGAVVRSDLSANFEVMLDKLAALPPEARSLVGATIADAVRTSIGADPTNRWRMQRFENILANVPTTYTKISAEAAPSASTAVVAVDSTVKSTKAYDAEQAIRRLSLLMEDQREIVARPTAAIRLTTPEVAEHVAAHFEELGYRAALFGWPSDPRVVIYDPLKPPVSVAKTELIR